MKLKHLPIFALCAGILTARAADNLQHPILSISSNSGSSANTVLSTWTESQYTNFFTPRYAPRNNGYGFAPAVVSGDTGWSWSQNSPTNLTSTPSGTIFPNPNTTTYPIFTQAVTTFTGDTVQAPYYLAAGSSSSKSLVFNVISYNQLGKRDSDLGNLAGAYVNTSISQATRDTYARRIAIELLDWARWYPDYTLTGKNSASFINTSPTYILDQDRQRASDHNGLAHEWNDTPLKAFDAIYDSDVLTNMNAEFGFDVRDYITSNIFFMEGDFFVNNVPISVATGSNLSGPYDVLPEVARVLNRPDYIVWLDQYLTATVTDRINRDGLNEEGQGYSLNYIQANITAAQNTRNYFLTRPATNAQFTAISNRAVVYANTLGFGQSQWSVACLPNGQLASFGDTTFDTYFSSRSTGNSVVLGAYGHVVMGAGNTSGTAVQVNQQYAGQENHMRSDTTAYALWAFGNEYLGNVRYYNGSIGRNWGEQMLEKDSVVIDRTDLSPFPAAETYGNANLNLYEPGNNGLAVTEIDGYRDYSSKASRYQRLLFLNSADLNKPYVVDVFRVTGGTNHDYTFHGAIRWTQSGVCSFPLVTNNNQYPMLEPGDPAWSLSTDTPYYGFFRGISSNTAPGNFYLTYLDTNRSTARDTRLWMTADPNVYNVYLGWTPVPARDNTVPTNFFNYLNLTRPSAVIRHRVASGPLSDLFVSVVEPINAGTTNIVSVQRLPMNGSSTESCALQITFNDGRVDTYVVNLQNPKVAGSTGGSASVSTADGTYALNGRIGVEMDRPNADSRVWTVNATDFKYPHRELSTPANTYYSGLVSGSTRIFDGAAYNAFTTTTPLPTGTALRGKSFSLTHGTLSGSGTTNISEMYVIDQVVLSNGFYYVCFTNDHYLEITNGVTSVEQVAPLRTFTTSNSFEIALTAFAGQISSIADQNITPSGSSGPISFNFGNLGTTSGSSLQVLASSSNPTLVPNGNIVIGGSGTNRTVTISPAAGQTGTSVITLSVTDGTWTNSRSFNAIVATYALTTTPATQAVLSGGSANFTNVVIATNGSGTVSFGVTGLPAGANASFNPLTLSNGGTNVMTITTTSNTTPAGSYPLTVTATAGPQVASNTVTLVVNVVNPMPGWVTWTGGSAGTANWSDSANWSSALAPGNSLNFSGLLRLNAVNDTTAGTSYSNIVFNPGAAAFTLTGNPITLVTGITNNSSVTQTIDLGINFSNSITLNGASGPLLIGGGFTNRFGAPGSTTVTLAGAGTLVNLLSSFNNPGGTNILLLNSPSANWTLDDNNTSATMTVPWVISVNNGAFNYGDASNAPNLTLTTPNNVPQDNQVGTVTGGVGVFNFVNGTLTTSARFNTATAQNSTGIVNQVGGVWNMGSQFQGANGGSTGEMSIVNLSGGTMNISGGGGTFYVASRGTGLLNISNATLNCSTLDVARNLTGAFEQHGTVNLNGGTLMVNSILKDASTNTSTGAFNFNGGTLQAKQNNAAFISTTNATPLVLTVKSGGAIIDDGGFSITNPLPLQHDATLGSTPDGGLTKLDTGTLALTGTNTYTGSTTLSNGTLALAGTGSISNSANIYLAAGATLDASKRNDGALNIVSGQTLSGNGSLVGNAVIAGVISPGADTVGSISNTSGSITFAAGGDYLFDMNDAVGQVGTNWDFLSATGALDCEATAGNPFVVTLRSIDNNINDGNPGAADFGNSSSQSWTMATGSSVLNFAANKFSVDDSHFQNDLAGGFFTVTAGGPSLQVTFVPNNPPAANDSTVYLPQNGSVQISLAGLASLWGDPDGDPVQFLGVNPLSANGNSVTTDGTYIHYSSPTNLSDLISYTIGDIRTNPPAIYRPGDTQRTGTGVIHILPPPAIRSLSKTGNNLVFSGSNGAPNGIYYVLTSTNAAQSLGSWTVLSTNSIDATGNFIFTNPVAPNTPQRFYLLKFQ